jgi:Zn-dependent protease with chaperone function
MTREVRQYKWFRSSVLVVGATFFIGAFLTLIRLWPMLREFWRPTTIDCGCATMAIQSPWWVIGIGVLAAGLIIFTIVRFSALLLSHVLASRRQLNELSQPGIRAILHHRSGARFFLIEAVEPIAVTSGLWRPQIYLSTGLLRRLTASEVAAVVAHEQAHQRARDPLMTAILDSLAKTFYWIPRATTWIAAAYSLRELSADAYATNSYRTTRALSSAFLKLNEVVPLAQGNAFSPNRDRIEKLLDQHWSRRTDWWNWATVGVVVLMFLAMLSIGRYAKAVVPDAPPVAADAACRQTMVMCQAERSVLPPPRTVCGAGQCLTAEHPWTPAYVISFTR